MSCTDNDYDLSDIDTNARFTVKDLVIPVNLDDITLDCVLEIDEDSKIKKNNNEYAVIEEGDFSSDGIYVNGFTTGSNQYVSTNTMSLTKPGTGGAPKRVRSDAGILLGSAAIPNNQTAIKASATNVDASIVSIGYLGTEMTITLSIKFDGLTNFVNKIDIENLQLQFLKGLDMTLNTGTYDKETGIINIGDAQTTSDHQYILTMNIAGIDATKAGVTLADGHFNIDEAVYVSSGRLALYSDQIAITLPVTLPTSVGYTLSATVGACKINTFSGDIQYDISGIDIDPIDMSDIPEMLQQEGTDIILDNPQIYLTVNNPLRQAGYPLNAQTGLSLTGNATYATAANAVVLDKVDNTFLLSPKKPDQYYQGYSSASHVPFPDLGKVISGKSFPKQIGIEVLSPNIPVQSVTDFKLDNTLPAVKGHWLLYAPLNLSSNSVIKYTKTWDDWQDEDLDNLTVEDATVTTTISSDVPLDLNVKFILRGREGELSGSTTLAPKAKNVELSIPLSGTAVTEIYGFTIDATIKGSNQSISPSDKVSVKNLKAKVNGHYDKEL